MVLQLERRRNVKAASHPPPLPISHRGTNARQQQELSRVSFRIASERRWTGRRRSSQLPAVVIQVDLVPSACLGNSISRVCAVDQSLDLSDRSLACSDNGLQPLGSLLGIAHRGDV